MRILHCCLAAFYIDNFSYQENIFPRMHKMQGHEVAIMASTETYIDTQLGYTKPSSYLNSDEIPVTRLPYVKWLPHAIAKKLRIYNGVSNTIADFKPDIIFIHDCQFISIKEIAAYAKKHAVRIYVDSHTDVYNSGRGWLSRNLLHKVIYKWCAQKIDPYTRKFYGVLPLRGVFYRDIYGINEEKIALLPLGADLTRINFEDAGAIRNTIRKELNLKNDDFVMISGGKLDKRKNIHTLMKIVSDLPFEDCKLIIFGKPTKEMKDEIDQTSSSPHIRYIGWIPAEKVYDYLLASDVAVFPGTHSVLWEQAVGIGLPCIFRRWTGIQHIDLNGNCLFLESSSEQELTEKILRLYNDKEYLAAMKKEAVNRHKEFSYYEIAKRAIEA